ncbi:MULTISPECIES: hypothetical protein [Pseudomonas]|jgi:hypothetical protein|uniref:Uncharacterized protein n=1 Tax=Pseudomonas chlororaphis subsp. aureofaciens TaxID=587851 RepID=A0AAD1E840_9PSED|nr:MULTISPECIES: hypothetical protein [Pseudomonas]AZD87047.1 hypothetical protein C4K14_4226 [Pseudomonas chlororaphis subsp. aureofaciens]AZD93397.1 hypothetical protein C4K13_3983 [Pseudomonas chlororaphis subsp. aureofaciens]AZD99698.1 hypothetical protein C4K12_3835 [Pseudomonas chlororaphis subsp. aureofaciens]AZE05897.1 hypothetical protein C4K11_3738 [Pseudomonas chlororaphis subsp. aureofaciens]AZE12109.1 hypothetical protein C4K10_3832 [Pseudomonas chlororaphis subsp. aureofaciens]
MHRLSRGRARKLQVRPWQVLLLDQLNSSGRTRQYRQEMAW